MFNLLSLILIYIGIFVIFSGIIGLYRFPDFFSKMHSASIIDTSGLILLLLGLILIQKNSSCIFKLCFIIFLIFVLGPITTHILGKAVYMKKINRRNNKRSYKHNEN